MFLYFFWNNFDSHLGLCTDVSVTWTLRTGVIVLQRAAAGRAGGDVLGHLTLMEAGLWVAGEVSGAQQLCFPLCVRTAG